MSDLPSSFYRAEAAWLEPPVYRADPDDLPKKLKEANIALERLISNLEIDIECSDEIDGIIDHLTFGVITFNALSEEIKEIEHEIRGMPDPDQAWDERGIWGED